MGKTTPISNGGCKMNGDGGEMSGDGGEGILSGREKKVCSVASYICKSRTKA